MDVILPWYMDVFDSGMIQEKANFLLALLGQNGNPNDSLDMLLLERHLFAKIVWVDGMRCFMKWTSMSAT